MPLKKFSEMKFLSFILAVLTFLSAGCREWDKLSKKDSQTLDGILAHWETWVPAKKKDGTAPLLTFDRLYRGLDQDQTSFLDRVRSIHPSDLDFDPKIPLKKIEGQPVLRTDGTAYPVGIQYLPENVYGAYEKMMFTMEKEIRKRLYVESGYRSPAYQLYTFLYYTPKHGYSLKAANRWVALPGHSEHGNPKLQAIDFISAGGINGDSDNHQTAEDFEVLDEFKWLTNNAGRFGFVMSYPRGHKSTSYEPWHWRYSPAVENRPDSHG